jgi:hypothetical protein
MKNAMVDVRNHLVAALERLGENELKPEDIKRADAISNLARTYTETVRVELEAMKALGVKDKLPAPLVPRAPIAPSLKCEKA